MNTVIKVEHISKKYILRHEQDERYKTFTGAISGQVRKLTKLSAHIKPPSKEEFWALNDINFEIQKGERVAIIGRNGAGKSTLLKVLSRIITPTSGRVEIIGRVSSLLEVGTGFHPELSGRENIFLNGSILGMTKNEIKKNFDEIVAFAEVEKFLDTPVKRYSSGMYVRLAFAVAAHLEPEILIVDEVLAVGDAEFQKKCLGKMNEVAGQGRTILFVSHNMAAVSALCPNTIVLKNGQISQMGPTDKIINSYLHSDEKNIGETTDDTPAKEGAKLKIRGVRILNHKQNLVSELNNSNEGFAEVTFEVLQEGRGYDVALHLSHLQYGPIFTTCLKDFDADENDSRVLTKGFYTYKVKLPMDILREGDYLILASAAIPKFEFLDTFKYETAFYIFDSISPVAKTTEGRGGAILPILKWEKK